MNTQICSLPLSHIPGLTNTCISKLTTNQAFSVAHACDTWAWKAMAGRALTQGYPGLHGKEPSQAKQANKQRRNQLVLL